MAKYTVTLVVEYSFSVEAEDENHAEEIGVEYDENNQYHARDYSGLKRISVEEEE